MKTNLRWLAILLALIITITSFAGCEKKDGDRDGGKETVSVAVSEKEDSEKQTETDAATETEAVKETEKETEPKKETVTEKDRETEKETVDPRLEYSRNREELEEMLVLVDEDFSKTEDKIKEFESLGVYSTDQEAVEKIYEEAEDEFYYLQTQIGIASIIYYLDMTDEEASSRYLDAYDLYGDVYNVYIECCKNVYNSSPIRDALFADWTEEDIEELFAYDPEIQELQERNEELLVEINELTGSDAYDKTAVLYAEMVTNYNLIAEHYGYDNYYLYASDKVYNRDYSIDEVDTFTSLVKEHFVPNLDAMNELWYNEYASLTSMLGNLMVSYLYDPFDSLARNYLKEYINSLDGSMKEGMSHMFENRNVIFTNSPNSHPSAFQTYLYDFETPFCLFGSEGQSTSTIVHEMGHYYAALYNKDSNSLDLAETQSQGNEMLLLDFLADAMLPQLYSACRDYNLYLYTVQSVVCVIIDEFERRVYSLDSVEGFTSEDFDAIMEDICEEYGGMDYVNENITDVNSYWRSVATNSPVYYITYAVTMTEALNIYAELREDRAAGREIYRKLCEEVTEDETFLGAMEKAGLSSPFEEITFVSIISLIMG